MAHDHTDQFSIDCLDCQVWAVRLDPLRRYRSNLSRPGRVSPPSSRIIGEGPHPSSCECGDCLPQVPGLRLLALLAWQFWHWTAVGQALYWWLALWLVAHYS